MFLKSIIKKETMDMDKVMLSAALPVDYGFDPRLKKNKNLQI